MKNFSNLSGLTPTQLATLHALLLKAGSKMEVMLEVKQAGYANSGDDFIDLLCEAQHSVDAE